MSLNWDDVQLFLRVVRAGSFCAAAVEAPLTQPTISRRIHALEERLGVRLFRRQVQGARLTPAGDAILTSALEMERSARLLEASAARETELSGRVRLWATDGIGGYWLPPRLAEFHKRYPAVTVDILCSQEPPKVDALEADIVVHWREPKHPDLVMLSSNKMTFCPCAAKSYLDIHGVPQTLSDLTRHRLCDHLHYPRDGEWKIWADLVDNSPSVCYRTNSSMTLGLTTIQGVGISLQPVGIVDREANLALLELDGYFPSITFWLVCHRETKDIPRMRALIDHLQTVLFRSQSLGSPFKAVADHS